VIAIDHTESRVAARADVVLPAATFAECDGTFVNYEGRAQRFYSVMTPRGEARESWCWLRDLALVAKRTELGTFLNLDDIDQLLAEALPVFAPIMEIAPSAESRIAGERIARQPHRYSGRTSMFANVTVHEPPPPEDLDSPLAFSMEGYQGEPPPALIPRFWAPGWNSIQALNKFQEEIAGPLRGGDPGKRLIEPTDESEADYFGDVPRRNESATGDYLFVPVHHIFGSEELSVLSPGVGSLAPKPYAGLNYDDAQGSSLTEEHEVEISVAGWSGRLPVKIIATLPSGMVALPVGLPGMPWLPLPDWGALRTPDADKEAG